MRNWTLPRKRKQLAFVLAGGGSRGALQAGALRALVEAGYRPDMLVGTSIGALNAAFLSLHGVNSAGIKGLLQTWRDAVHLDPLPANYLWLTVRTLFNRPGTDTSGRLREFMIVHGLTPDLKFRELPGPRLFVVATDMHAQTPFVYGIDPDTSVLDAVIASTTLPPWFRPIEKEDMLLLDGGVVSNLPIEAALDRGATEIIAVDMHDSRPLPNDVQGFGSFLSNLIGTVQARTRQLELTLAEVRKVRVQIISLVGEEPVSIWDFRKTEELLERGYEIARQEIEAWKHTYPPGQKAGLGWLQRIFPGRKPSGPGDTNG